MAEPIGMAERAVTMATVPRTLVVVLAVIIDHSIDFLMDIGFSPVVGRDAVPRP